MLVPNSSPEGSVYITATTTTAMIKRMIMILPPLPISGLYDFLAGIASIISITEAVKFSGAAFTPDSLISFDM